jgi:hypothetical protein
MDASEFVTSGLVACIPRGCLPPFRCVRSATYFKKGRERRAVAEVEMFDGATGIAEVWRWRESGWAFQWNRLDGGAFSLEDGEWKRVGPLREERTPAESSSP